MRNMIGRGVWCCTRARGVSFSNVQSLRSIDVCTCALSWLPVLVWFFSQKRAAMDPLFRHAMMAQQGVRPGGALALLSSMFAADKAEAARKAEEAAAAAAIAAAEGGAGGSGEGGGGGGGSGGGSRRTGRLHTSLLYVCCHCYTHELHKSTG
jgi:hypothetical protein